MRHRHKGRILKRKRGQRNALARSLMRSLVMKKSIVTTEAKAKEIRPHIEKLVTKVRSGSLAAYRHAVSQIGHDAAQKLRDDIVPAVKKRPGGYTRITRYPVRKSDAARRAHISFVDTS